MACYYPCNIFRALVINTSDDAQTNSGDADFSSSHEQQGELQLQFGLDLH